MSALYNLLRLLLLNPNLRARPSKQPFLRRDFCSTLLKKIAPSIIMISVSCLVLVHHITMLFKWPLALAAIDWVVTLGEVSVVGYAVCRWGLAFLVQLVPLTLAVIFRTTSIMNSPDGLHRQHFDFLGGCAKSKPGYTPLRILINRSLSRPLIRGESRRLMTIRGLALSMQCPLQADVLMRQKKGLPYYMSNSTEDSENARIILSNFNMNGNYNLTTDVVAKLKTGNVNCSVNYTSDLSTSLADYFSPRTSPEFPDDMVYVTPGRGDSSDILQYSDPIPIIRGSHLVVLLTWTEIQVFKNFLYRLVGPLASSRTITSNRVNFVQPEPFRLNDSVNIATLRLIQRDNVAMTLIEEYTETSAVMGIAGLGGMWTMVSGRRPLSPLGLAHTFHRRRLMQKLHEDFPALRTEGGDPGTENAGVVAFLRERLVDLDDDDDEGTHDLEAPNMEYGKDAQTVKNGESALEFNSGYYLEEIQPMDMALGVEPPRGEF
ncbi:hypothetical protein B0H13DRAFT_2264067 [Mycena leptocephala]|nr:hypothetical protein B0H13DRAFT_2264067 [Mycena leptocephala]